jgi:hypothetical protein
MEKIEEDICKYSKKTNGNSKSNHSLPKKAV